MDISLGACAWGMTGGDRCGRPPGFYQTGQHDGNVPMKDTVYCATSYTRPQMRIVQPMMTICLGAKTFNSLRRAMGMSELKFSEASEPSSHSVYKQTGAEIYGVPHTED